MVTVRTTDDLSVLRRLLEDDDIREALGDDTTPQSPDLSVFVPSGSKVYQVDVDGAPEGVFVLRPESDDVYEVHTILSPACRGKLAIEAARKMLADVFASGVRGISSQVFNDAPATRWFAHRLGFREVSQHPYPHTRHGHPVEIVNLFLSRP